jgi:hypothetical protein
MSVGIPMLLPSVRAVAPVQVHKVAAVPAENGEDDHDAEVLGERDGVKERHDPYTRDGSATRSAPRPLRPSVNSSTCRCEKCCRPFRRSP